MTKSKLTIKKKPSKKKYVESQIREQEERKKKSVKTKLPDDRLQEFLRQVRNGQSDIMLRYSFKLEKEDLRRLEKKYNLDIYWVTDTDVMRSGYRDVDFTMINIPGLKNV